MPIEVGLATRLLLSVALSIPTLVGVNGREGTPLLGEREAVKRRT